MSNITLLIAEDNQKINHNLSQYLQGKGFRTISAFNGEEALALFHQNPVDLVLLDIMMPKIDGFEVCRQLRQTSMVPIIMITARGEDFERIMGLDIGADDYIVKPFSSDEVVARINALLRRIYPKEKQEELLHFNNLTLNLSSYKVFVDEKEIPLTKKEFDILWTLASHPSKVFTRDNLLDSLWGYDYYGDSRTVDSHIKRLRSKLPVSKSPSWEIKTVRGVGYQFEVNQ